MDTKYPCLFKHKELNMVILVPVINSNGIVLVGGNSDYKVGSQICVNPAKDPNIWEILPPHETVVLNNT